MTAPPDKNRDKFAWHEAVLTDPQIRYMAAKVLAGYLMHRFDRRRLSVEIAEATLAQDLNLSISTVKRAVKVLRENWLLISIGRHGANLYRLNMQRVPMCQARVKALREARNEARRGHDVEAQFGAAHHARTEPLEGSELSPIPFGHSLGRSHFIRPPIENRDQEEINEKQDALLERLAEKIMQRSNMR